MSDHYHHADCLFPDCEWPSVQHSEACIRADERVRIAARIESEKYPAGPRFGSVTFNGRWYEMREVDFELVNAIRDLDARIARGSR